MQIEFYGIPRKRCGVATATASGLTLGDVLADLAARFPDFDADCLAESQHLQDHVIANVNGNRFIRESDQRLGENDVLMILSADGGG